MVAQRELVRKWRKHVFRSAEGEIRRLLERFPDRRQLSISYRDCGTDYRLTAPLVSDPDRTLEAGRQALAEFSQSEFDAVGTVDADDRIYLRVTDVPDSVRLPLASIGADHLNRLVAVEATVAAVEASRPRIVTAAFYCDRCGEYSHVPQRGPRLRTRSRCPSCTAIGTTTLAPDRSEYVDAQVIRLGDGEHTVPLSLEHDLVDAFESGDDLGVVAIPRARPGDDASASRTTVDVELEAISARRDDGDDGDR